MDKRFEKVYTQGALTATEIWGNTAQMRWSAGEWIFRQMQMQISKVYWR